MNKTNTLLVSYLRWGLSDLISWTEWNQLQENKSFLVIGYLNSEDDYHNILKKVLHDKRLINNCQVVVEGHHELNEQPFHYGLLFCNRGHLLNEQMFQKCSKIMEKCVLVCDERNGKLLETLPYEFGFKVLYNQRLDAMYVEKVKLRRMVLSYLTHIMIPWPQYALSPV